MADLPLANQQAERETIRVQVLDRIERLPSLSSVVHEFLELARKDYFTAKDFERVIVKDQALVARLLKVANSGFFGGSRAINTIPEAVVLVGLDNMKNMVYAVSSGGMMLQELKCYRYPARGFWLHAMGVGITCRALSEISKSGTLRGEEVFVAGLLHDIAKLIIDDFLDPEPGPRKIGLDEELANSGLTHTELGEHIMKRWNIPDPIIEAVRYHHEPNQNGEWRLGGAVVNLADAICNTWGIGTEVLMDLGEDIWPGDYSDILAALGIPEEALPTLLLKTRQKLAKMENFYGEE
jgi:HD-like signal output (HDOD) protein